jgi:DNA-binding CsgD family transcriptional regulator
VTDASQEAYLAHYGVLRRSGRYPWGSGGPEYASSKSFLGYVAQLRAKGMSDPEIARGMGISTTELRAAKSIARNEERQAQINMAQRLKDKGWSNVAIAERLKVGESQVRALLQPGVKDRTDVLTATTNMLKNEISKKKYIDIGSGVENHLGISSTKLATAVAALKEENYPTYYVKVKQLGTGNYTTMKVLTAPGVSYSEVFKNKDAIQQIRSYSEDHGRSYSLIQPPMSISSKRVAVRYAEDGGADADGVIYVRPGVKDTSLGKSNYAQVRIAVDGTHYLKGMAMYRDDLPPGVDLLFNTNKSDKTGNKLDAMKELKKDDPENPFGSVVRQRTDPKTGKVNSVMNIVNEEGDWTKWSRKLSSQMLSKQSPALAREQLLVTLEKKKAEFDEIDRLTNPVVKQKLMEAFADGVDSSAVQLKAAALPRQSTSVILPINSLKDKEIYAPNYRNGERVVLIRHPHGGIFEIPELTVNNRHPEAKKILGQAKDAVGINSKVAERLSGADFDGDTVLVIPNNKGLVKTAPALDGLKGFDPQRAYPSYEGMKRMTPRAKQLEMGDISNLITDMTIRGATTDEIARAVRHSMVVIDAEKHNLNYRQSAVDNGIAQLKKKYQGGPRAGASTLVSRATSSLRVEDRKARPAAEGGAVDRDTGKKVYVPTGETYTNKSGKLVKRMVETQRLAEVDDAHALSSGTTIERVYADHSNSLKSLANKARKIAVSTKPKPYSPSAKLAFESEVKTLRAKLDLAKRNRPLERQAQLIANAAVQARLAANPGMEKSEIKKIQQQQLRIARARTGAGKNRIHLTDNEWAAIQAGAISTHTLKEILANADLDRVKELATPRTETTMSPAKISRARSMLALGYTQSEIADQLGVSVSTLNTTI